VTAVRAWRARFHIPERLKQLVRALSRRFDRARLAYLDATYTPLGQHAVRLLIASAVLVVILLFSVAVIWFT